MADSPSFLSLLISDADPLSRTPAPVCRHGDNRMSLEGRRAFRRDVTRVVPRYKQDGWVTNRLLTMCVCFASPPSPCRHIHGVLFVLLKEFISRLVLCSREHIEPFYYICQQIKHAKYMVQSLPWKVDSYKIVQFILCRNSMEKIFSWEAGDSSATTDILSSLWNLEVHCHAHNSSHRAPKPSQINQIHPHSHLVTFRSSLILYSHLFLCLPSGLHSSAFPPKTLYSFLFYPHTHTHTHTPHIPQQSHSTWFVDRNFIYWTVLIMKLILSFFSPPAFYLVPLRPKCLPQHPILEHRQPVFLPQCKRPSFMLI